MKVQINQTTHTFTQSIPHLSNVLSVTYWQGQRLNLFTDSTNLI